MTLEICQHESTGEWTLIENKQRGPATVVVGPGHGPRYLFRWVFMEFDEGTDLELPEDLPSAEWEKEIVG